jgi:hypothetical protein
MAVLRYNGACAPRSSELLILRAGSSAGSVSGPERQDEQAGDCYCQADLRPLTYESYAVPHKELVLQRRVGKPADSGIRVAPRDETSHQDRDKARHWQDGSRKSDWLRCLLFPGCVFPHAGESSGAARRDHDAEGKLNVDENLVLLVPP